MYKINDEKLVHELQSFRHAEHIDNHHNNKCLPRNISIGNFKPIVFMALCRMRVGKMIGLPV